MLTGSIIPWVHLWPLPPFRHPGRKTLINQLIDEYDRGKEIDLKKKNVDVHTAASVLKTYLRQLPEPLIPFSKFEEMSTYGSKFIIQSEDMSFVHDLVIKGLQSLPPWNYNLLKFIIHFLYQVSSYSQVNKMDINNLAAVHAPNILRMEHDTPQLLASVNNVITETTSAFIQNYDLLFAGDFKEPESIIPEIPSNDGVNSEQSSSSEVPCEPSNMPTAMNYTQLNVELKAVLQSERSLREQVENDLRLEKAKTEELTNRLHELEETIEKLQKKLNDYRLRHGSLA